MVKKIEPRNSTLILFGLVIICIGIGIGFYEIFQEKKEKAFSEMNILLYESEIPDNIESDNDIVKPEEPEIPPEQPSEPEKPVETKYDYIGILEIPKINLKRGFLDLNSRYNNINYNVTVINGSTFPDEINNNLILAAHSGNCQICFFDRLFNLSKGDSAYVYYKNIKYTYKIVNIYEVDKTGTVAIYRDYSKNTLTLITCTRYSNTKQTVYILELQNKVNY